MRMRWVILGGVLVLMVVGLVIAAGKLSENVVLKARAVQSQALMVGMTIGIKTFQLEYNHLPVAPPAPADETTWQRSQGAILNMLMGKDPKANPLKISFFDPPAAKNKGLGLYDDESKGPVLTDAWGDPFYYVMDLNGDGKIPNPDPRSNKANPFINQTVIMISAGPDHDPNTWDDNVLSWR